LNIVTAIQNGEENWFKLAYEENHEKTYFYFLKKTKSSEDAKDLLQTTFLKLWQYRNSISPDFALEQQIFHIARTVFIDHIRKQNRQLQFRKEASMEAGTEAIQESFSTYFDTQKLLQSALITMPEMRKKVFELNRLQGYTYREIAELLSISEKAVDNHLTKAVKQLKKVLPLLMLLSILGK